MITLTDYVWPLSFDFLKMRSYWMKVALNPMTHVLIRRLYEDTDTGGRTAGEYGDRDCSDPSTSQRTSQIGATARS